MATRDCKPSNDISAPLSASAAQGLQHLRAQAGVYARMVNTCSWGLKPISRTITFIFVMDKQIY
jgi:hypothetical protein